MTTLPGKDFGTGNSVFFSLMGQHWTLNQHLRSPEFREGSFERNDSPQPAHDHPSQCQLPTSPSHRYRVHDPQQRGHDPEFFVVGFGRFKTEGRFALGNLGGSDFSFQTKGESLLFKILRAILDISGSSCGQISGKNSIISTSAPSLDQTQPSSNPIAPAPITAIFWER